MIVSIHQPHYFPWFGYFDKMAKSDTFVLLDEVQFEKGSQMIRNRVIDNNGDIKYITISADTKDYLNKPYCELQTKNIDIWTTKQKNSLQNYYRYSDFYKEIFPIISEFLSRDYATVCEWTIESIKLVRELLGIDTPIIFQSEVEYDRTKKRSDLVYAICNALGASEYLSGRGASVDYLDREKFAENGVQIVFQDIDHPVYNQCNTDDFIKGISIIDMLFNCGITGTKEKFWEAVNKSKRGGEHE